MIVWGGYSPAYRNTGGIYNAATDSWTATTTTGAPTPRGRHAAVWTGSKMVVWGGDSTAGWGTNTGATYDPDQPTPGANFYTVTPCRLADTRSGAAYPIKGGQRRRFFVTGDICGIPATAVAIAANVTVVEALAPGHLVIWRGDWLHPPAVSSLNFAAGSTRANSAVVSLAPNGLGVKVQNNSAGPVHVVLDVSGYFE